MAQVFASKETFFFYSSAFLLHDSGVLVSLKLQTFSECNLLKPQPAFWLCKLVSGVPVNAVTTLMLMLAKVNAFHSSYYQTLIKHSAPKAGQI